MSAKKIVEAPGGTQSAAARKSAEAELRTLIDIYAPAHLKLVDAARKWLLKRLPTAHEIIYEYGDCFVISYAPTEHGYEGVLALRASADAVLLYFNNGKGLPDPAKLLRGSAKQVRFINLDSASTFARPEIAQLIDLALARNEVPYPLDGRGSMVIRSTSAQKRRQTKEPS